MRLHSVIAHAALVTVAVMALSPSRASAETEKGVLGIGLIIGEPTGVCGKFYLGNDRAIDFAVGFAFLGRGAQVHADYLFHPAMLQNTDVFALPFYAGVGARFLRRDDGDQVNAHSRFGVRGVVGLQFDFHAQPLDVFVEAALVGDYRTSEGDRFGLDINAGAGVRYYF